MTNKYNLADLYEDTYVFNDLAGNTQKVSFADMKNQHKLILEEIGEITEAFDENDPVELLDGVVDSFVVLSGLASKLESLGFDVSKALAQTAENNLSKFPQSEKVAMDTVDMYDAKGIKTMATFNQLYNAWVITDENGKVRKPTTFVDNDLSNCVPAGFELK